MLTTDIIYFGEKVTAACDLKCEKACGLNNRPSEQLSDDIDDIVWLADSELGDAPEHPGTSEGGECKPFHPEKHNKWCVRECERSITAERGQPLTLKDWSARVYNQPRKHGVNV